ncbi:MAG: peptidylprolyl isomerase [Corynebacterium sp.]|nr:peptidylprolyl isomerase [Corynebacterium sp.]
MADDGSKNNRQIRDESFDELRKALAARERKQKTQPLGVVAASLVVILVLVGGIMWFATRDNNETQTADGSTSPTSSQYAPLATQRATALPATVSCAYPTDGVSPAAKPVTAPATENVSAEGTVDLTLATNQGDIALTLDRAASPCTVNAITSLAKQGYYDGTVCHRITTSGIFVLQCGDPSGTGAGGPGFEFANEYPTDEATDQSTPVVYSRGTIAMANAGADTNGSQFFLNYEDSPLPPNYTYFGQISQDGLFVLDAIAARGTAEGASDGAPAEEVRITAAKVS